MARTRGRRAGWGVALLLAACGTQSQGSLGGSGDVDAPTDGGRDAAGRQPVGDAAEPDAGRGPDGGGETPSRPDAAAGRDGGVDGGAGRDAALDAGDAGAGVSDAGVDGGANLPPAVSFTASKLVLCAGDSVDFDAAASSDPDGRITGYVWRWQDGSGDGAGAQASHVFSDPGAYDVTLTVTDDQGLQTSGQLSIRVVGGGAADRTWSALDASAPSAWDRADNWCPRGVPAAGHSVLIPAGLAHYPQSQVSGSIGALTLEAGASLDLQDNDLQVSGDLRVDGVVDGTDDGWLHMVGPDTTVSGAGSISVLVVDLTSGSVTQGSDLTVSNDLQLWQGAYELGAHTLSVGDQVRLSGRLWMRDASARLEVGGELRVDGPYIPDLAASHFRDGVVAARGGVTMRGNRRFMSAGTELRFEGSADQPWRDSDFENRYADVTVDTSGSVSLRNTVQVDGSFRLLRGELNSRDSSGALVSSELRLAGDLVDSAGDRVRPNVLRLNGVTNPALPERIELDDAATGTLVVDAPVTLAHDLVVTGNLTVDSESPQAALELAGHSVQVTEDFEKRGRLIMRDPSDRLLVLGDVNVLSFSVGTGDTTQGLLEVRGDFSCGLSTSHSAAYFEGSGEHTVKLSGSQPQAVKMRSSGCVFNDLVIANSADDSADPAVVLHHAFRRINRDVTVLDGRTVSADDSTWQVIGRDLHDESGLWEVLTVMEGADPQLPDQVNAPWMELQQPTTLTHDVSFAGNLRLANPQGELNLGGHTVSVAGDFQTNGAGWLIMHDGADVLDVEGDAAFNGIGGGVAGGDPDSLTAGEIRVAGDLSCPPAQGASLLRYLVTRGTHVVLDGTSTQQIRLNCQDHRLSKLTITGPDVVNRRGHLNITKEIIIDGGALTLCEEGRVLAKCQGSLFSPIEKCEGPDGAPGLPTLLNGGTVDISEFTNGAKPYVCSDPDYNYWPGWP